MCSPDEPYLMGAEAIADSSVWSASRREPMRQVVAAQPAAAMAMMRAMSAELGNMTRQVVDLKVRIAAQRLGTYLLSQVKEPTATQAQFRLPVPKGLLAPWLGCRAENLSRAFMSLRAYGVETHGSRVVLHDIARLQAYAGLSDSVRPEVVQPARAGGKGLRRRVPAAATRKSGAERRRLTRIGHADDQRWIGSPLEMIIYLCAWHQPAVRLSAGARLSRVAGPDC